MTEERYYKLLHHIIVFLGDLEDSDFPTIRKYLKKDKKVAVKWLNENMKTERQYNFSEYMSWTEQSLDEIDFYSGIDINQK
ncbi:MAG: hypothetical protein H8E84_01290 [Flavobacteriales bacterium]|nr:hypothetical protein [Flavobacteriales bacterium]